ncbi:hypothetical protein L6164_023082 [Bauhinia variegata]|uniref:Uncharacterized protein n=1 Tax=Bauhinia variegata TaxID=167791 RepID=A0ACB9MHL3_BAUVA|nr:hypothetical protein L6164_023082 [Bauhinia variegata]
MKKLKYRKIEMEESSRGRQAGRIAGKDVLSRLLSDADRVKIKKALRGVKVEVTQRGHVRRKYRVSGLTSQPTRELVFPVDDNSTMNGKSEKKANCLPMEACKIFEGQRCTKRLDEKQITALLKVTCQRPPDRENDILRKIQHNAYDQDPHAKEFGIKTSGKLASVEARILPAPWDLEEVMGLVFLRLGRCRGLYLTTGAYGKPIFVDKLGASLDSISNGVPLEDFGHGHPDPNVTAVLAWLSILAQANEGKKPGEKMISVFDIVKKHWETYGRNFFSRYGYEEYESEGANKMVEYLQAFFSKRKPGDKFGSYSIQFADDFTYTGPEDGSMVSKQGVWFVFTDGSRIIFHLSGTGSAGASIRVYIEQTIIALWRTRLLAPEQKAQIAELPIKISDGEIRMYIVDCESSHARHGAKTQDEEGRLRFHFQSFVSFGAASRTIMALWRTRLLTPEQKAQTSELPIKIPEIKLADIPDVEVIDPVSDYLELLETFDFPLIKNLLTWPDFRFIFDATHAVTGAYGKLIFVDKLGASLD